MSSQGSTLKAGTHILLVPSRSIGSTKWGPDIFGTLRSCRRERILLISKHQPTQQDAGGISRDLMTEFHINLNQKIRHTLFFLRPSFQLRDSTWHSQFKTGWLWRQEDPSYYLWIFKQLTQLSDSRVKQVTSRGPRRGQW